MRECLKDSSFKIDTIMDHIKVDFIFRFEMGILVTYRTLNVQTIEDNL